MKKRHSSERIVKMLREAEAKIAEGRTIEEVCREMGVSEATYYKWRKSYGQMKVDQVKRLKDLEKESGRLKKLVAAMKWLSRRHPRYGYRRVLKTLSQSGGRFLSSCSIKKRSGEALRSICVTCHPQALVLEPCPNCRERDEFRSCRAYAYDQTTPVAEPL